MAGGRAPAGLGTGGEGVGGALHSGLGSDGGALGPPDPEAPGGNVIAARGAFVRVHAAASVTPATTRTATRTGLTGAVPLPWPPPRRSPPRPNTPSRSTRPGASPRSARPPPRR